MSPVLSKSADTELLEPSSNLFAVVGWLAATEARTSMGSRQAKPSIALALFEELQGEIGIRQWNTESGRKNSSYMEPFRREKMAY